MDKKQLLNTIEQIDYKILEHISNDEFDIEPTQIPDYLLTARRVLLERVRVIEVKERQDIENKEREQRILGRFYKGSALFEKDEKETFIPLKE